MSETLTAPAEAAPAQLTAPAAPTASATSFLSTSPVAESAPVPAQSNHFFGEHVVKDGAFVEGWSSQLAETHPALANQMARYKTEADAFTGLENLVKTVGRKQAGVSYPKEGSTPEEIAAFRTEAGVPGRAEEYMLKPEQLPAGYDWSDATSKEFSELMHVHHVPKGAAQAIVQAYVQNAANQAVAEHAAAEAKLGELVQKTTAEMQKEWGVNYEQRFAANSDFITTIFTAAELADPALKVALSHPAMVRIIDTARRETRESPLPGAGNTIAVGSQSPREQAKAIQQANPNWRNDKALCERVSSLYAQESAAMKRKAR
jgi:hypothetical protein